MVATKDMSLSGKRKYLKIVIMNYGMVIVWS